MIQYGNSCEPTTNSYIKADSAEWLGKSKKCLVMARPNKNNQKSKEKHKSIKRYFARGKQHIENIKEIFNEFWSTPTLLLLFLLLLLRYYYYYYCCSLYSAAPATAIIITARI